MARGRRRIVSCRTVVALVFPSLRNRLFRFMPCSVVVSCRVVSRRVVSMNVHGVCDSMCGGAGRTHSTKSARGPTWSSTCARAGARPWAWRWPRRSGRSSSCFPSGSGPWLPVLPHIGMGRRQMPDL